MKKIFSLILTVALAASLIITAFAASEYSITVNNQADNVSIIGNTYSAYKVFNVNYNEDKTAFSYTVSDEFAALSYSGKTGSDLIDLIATFENNSDELNAFADAAYAYAVANSIAAAGSVKATAETGNVIELASAGYYLVYGQADAADASETTAKITAACSLTTIKPTSEINVKADAPTIDKIIVDADDGVGKGTSVNVGDTVSFRLDSKVPDMTGYATYKFIVHDTMSAGLSFDASSVAVTVAGAEVAFDIDTSTDETFVLTVSDLTQYSKGDAIVITYSAVLNDSALTTSVESNTVKLEYSNNPYDENSTTKTPEKTTFVYDFNILIDKYNEADESVKLEGAKFILTKKDADKTLYYFWNDTDKKVEWKESEDDATVITTDENGAGTFYGVEAGEYQLTETEAPNGYNKLNAPIDVTITATYAEDGTIASTNAVISETQYVLEAGVANASGSELPATGGRGTVLFYIIGGILLVGASVLLITKACTKKDEN